MSRKEELLKIAKLFHSQADLVSSRAAKQALRKMGDYYRHEADQMRGQSSPNLVEQGKHGFRFPKSAA
jgi:hypothetical protein